MFGLACKGLHCAGCGRGIPLAIIIALGTMAMAGAGILADLFIYLALIGAVAWIATLGIFAAFLRKGPAVAFVRTPEITYSEMKYIETGDPRWLALHGGTSRQLETRQPMKAEVVLYRDTR